ncbi:sulfurtransferase TusA family protein [Desulfobacca acetoxidans]|uniref:SirA-like domain-containing protein n=1 Tax=Desulfobacca acetoxidans (strain ATCC 700848 / DSM 11109 / ASRB2) TaxID=880072 RepID=F2NF05_DESAR|nr:sulfurtransferase TusA family protein [Desulfobacca acetoxidans]AEB08345.1 SirA-like domain-containing protein [Desulfobacca acetoxidans DSM 11109]
MSSTIDARGLSCPQPVLLALQAMKKIDRGPLIVLVDTDTSKENVLRAAASQGWREEAIQEQGGEYHITLTKASL